MQDDISKTAAAIEGAALPRRRDVHANADATAPEQPAGGAKRPGGMGL